MSALVQGRVLVLPYTIQGSRLAAVVILKYLRGDPLFVNTSPTYIDTSGYYESANLKLQPGPASIYSFAALSESGG